jgi:misacylated tRNA(Ala) deacylase
MKTEFLFRADAYLKTSKATISAITPTGGLIVNRSNFYPTGGGQPGDKGRIRSGDHTLNITNTIYGEDRESIVLVPEHSDPSTAPHFPSIGETITMELDWPLRLLRMRVHTCLHLLTTVLPYPVTGGAIGDGEGRLDFDIPDAGLEKEAIEAELARRIATHADVTEEWITDEDLLAKPELVKTMSVKPPMGSGRVRLVRIAGLDLQPCGGTHVRNTAEIGTVVVTGIEKKGKQNRRVRIALA